MKEIFPKISCLCVTHHRIKDLDNAVNCFRAQTYPNKELLIVFERSDSATEAYTDTLSDSEIRVYKYYNGRGTLTLGDIRNISINEAKGEYFCLWDDDDWYHQDRLTWQMKHILLSKKKAAALLFIITYDKTSALGYLSGPRPWEQTILCHKQLALQNGGAYAPLNRGEDTEFIKKLVMQDEICPVIKPQLYIYNYTGNNTWNAEHFKKVFSHAHPLNEQQNTILSQVINSGSICSASDIIDNPSFTRNLSYKPLLDFFLHKAIWYDPGQLA